MAHTATTYGVVVDFTHKKDARLVVKGEQIVVPMCETVEIGEILLKDPEGNWKKCNNLNYQIPEGASTNELRLSFKQVNIDKNCLSCGGRFLRHQLLGDIQVGDHYPLELRRYREIKIKATKDEGYKWKICYMAKPKDKLPRDQVWLKIGKIAYICERNGHKIFKAMDWISKRQFRNLYRVYEEANIYDSAKFLATGKIRIYMNDEEINLAEAIHFIPHEKYRNVEFDLSDAYTFEMLEKQDKDDVFLRDLDPIIKNLQQFNRNDASTSSLDRNGKRASSMASDVKAPVKKATSSKYSDS
ncbi:unnamed protein product [Caenorhabditis bovis]|uniref:Uncharacterized protein n=1 Tax=Caenorhabditis bovis TaxID=2654633 RepID=A0A8S1FDA5_9PELO|nr:unnamed protein product [Caenorhabditis bovis]